jgi:hypothetical protein
MNLHPEIATALTAQRVSELLRRSEQHRMLPKRERLVEPIRFRRRPQLGLDGRSP